MSGLGTDIMFVLRRTVARKWEMHYGSQRNESRRTDARTTAAARGRHRPADFRLHLHPRPFHSGRYAPAYADGYEDGTSSGYNAARGRPSGVRRDTYRYESDTDYRQGWDDGYSVSKRDYHSRH